MKTGIRLAILMASLGGWSSQAMAGATVYVPLGEAGEVMVGK